MTRGDSTWSRFWGGAAALGFWLYLGAALYDAAVVAPQWAGSPPQSVRTWNQSGVRPEPAPFLTPLAIGIVGATTLAWASSLTVRSRRRLWLTIAQVAALGLGWIVILELMPLERSLRGAGFSDAEVVSLTNEWVRWGAARLAVLAVGAYAAYRGHILRVRAAAAPAAAVRRAAPRDFVLYDEDRDRITLGDD
jgi:hypothetical protein